MLKKQQQERRDRLARAGIEQPGEKAKPVSLPRAALLLPAEILVYPAFVFAHDVDRQPITLLPATRIRQIQDLVCKMQLITRADLLSSRRDRTTVMARHIAMYLCKRCTSHSYPEIARRFGDLDHTTVLSGARRVAKIMATPPGTTISLSWQPAAMDEVRAQVHLAEATISNWNEEQPLSRCRAPGARAQIG